MQTNEKSVELEALYMVIDAIIQLQGHSELPQTLRQSLSWANSRANYLRCELEEAKAVEP